MFGKTPVMKISEESQKNIFGKVLFKDTLKTFDDFKNKQQKCLK